MRFSFPVTNNFRLSPPLHQLYMPFAIIQSMPPILQTKLPEGKPAETKQTRLNLLLIPLGCLIRSPLFFLSLAVAIGIFSWFAYTRFNWDFLGLAAPEYQDWEVSTDYTSVADQQGRTWEISYENGSTTTFTGLVRHITPIREFAFPLLTHDILVTYGDYANPEMVFVDVANHRFSWSAPKNDRLSGGINLLHALPQDEQIYRTLLKVRKGDWVEISGREIRSIDFLADSGQKTATWTDFGCNSLLITRVEFINPQD